MRCHEHTGYIPSARPDSVAPVSLDQQCNIEQDINHRTYQHAHRIPSYSAWLRCCGNRHCLSRRAFRKWTGLQHFEPSIIALSNDALFGNGSHAILFLDGVLETQRFGLRLTSNVEGYNSSGSERLSVWYKIIKDEPNGDATTVSLSIALTNDLNVTIETDTTELVHQVEGEWSEHVWAWVDFEVTTGDEKLMPYHIREWQLSIEASAGMTELVDHLSCTGDRLLEALFLSDSTFPSDLISFVDSCLDRVHGHGLDASCVGTEGIFLLRAWSCD